MTTMSLASLRQVAPAQARWRRFRLKNSFFRDRVAVALFLAVVIISVADLLLHPSFWAGRWTGLFNEVADGSRRAEPVMVALGVWVAARDNRCGVKELMSTVSSSNGRIVWSQWSVLTGAAVLASAAAALAGAVFVAPVATFAPGWLWQPVALVVVRVAAFVAIGLAIGRWLPHVAVVPLTALVTYLLVSATPSVLMSLNPALGWQVEYLPYRVMTWLLLWLLGVGGIALSVAMVRGPGRRPLVTVVILVTSLATAALSLPRSFPSVVGWRTTAWAQTDESGTALVCNGSRSVCLSHVNAFLLPELTERTAPVFAKLSGIAGAPTRVVDVSVFGPDVVDQAARLRDPSVLPLYTVDVTLRGHLGAPARGTQNRYFEAAEGATYYWATGLCQSSADPAPALAYLLQAWALGWTSMPWPDQAAEGPLQELNALPLATQRAWVAASIAALKNCAAADGPTTIAVLEHPKAWATGQSS